MTRPRARRDGAGAFGAAFANVEDEEEWQGWVDWATVEVQTGGASSSA